MNKKLLFLLIFLLSINSHSISQNSKDNSNHPKRLLIKKFAKEACKQINVLQDNFSNVMSSKYRDNTVKLNKAIEYLDKVFDKRAKIEILDSNGKKREVSVRKYFTKTRRKYLKEYSYLNVSFKIKCDENDFKYVKNGIVGNISFEQEFTGMNNQRVYFDITIKNILIRSNTDTYEDGTINYYDVKFTGIKAIRIKESRFMEPIKG